MVGEHPVPDWVDRVILLLQLAVTFLFGIIVGIQVAP